jgi:hypothetical protein
VLPGISSEDLDRFEQAHGVKLAPDTREFLQTVNGFEEGEWDEEMVAWYPLSKWECVAGGPDTSESLTDTASYFLFANYFIDSLLYLVRVSSNPDEGNAVFGWTGGDPPFHPIASSFTAFLEAYLQDSSVMLF